MDVDEVRRISARLKVESANIGQLVSRVNSQIAVARQAWKGTDSNHFIESWQAKQRQLKDIQTRIERLSASALSQANEQAATSRGM